MYVIHSATFRDSEIKASIFFRNFPSLNLSPKKCWPLAICEFKEKPKKKLVDFERKTMEYQGAWGKTASMPEQFAARLKASKLDPCS